jgi:hypothetical protein
MSPHTDGKTFSNLLTSLDLLDKKLGHEVVEKRSPSYSTQHMRYKRVLDTPKSGEHDGEPYLEVRKQTTNLLKRNINTEEYCKSLLDQGINPQVPSIKKLINHHESGDIVKFHDLFTTIVKNKDESAEEPKFNPKISKFYKTSIDKETFSGNMIEKSYGQLVQMPVKRRVNNNNNSYHSNKEFFDWDLCALKKIKSGELQTPSLSKNNPNHKNIYTSQVFGTASPVESPKRNKATTSAFIGSGDILSWNGKAPSEDFSLKGPKRRNPNEVSNHTYSEKKPTKVFTLLSTSKENGLNFN